MTTTQSRLHAELSCLTSPFTPSHPSEQGEQKKPKNIIICCDGTGNEFGYSNSNVLKLYTTLDLERPNPPGCLLPPRRRHHGRRPPSATCLRKSGAVIEGLAFGAGFNDNVFDAYRYLMEIYNEGDRIYPLRLLPRSLHRPRPQPAVLHGYGLLHRGNEGHLAYAWRALRRRSQKAAPSAQESRCDRNVANASHHRRMTSAFASTFSHANFGFASSASGTPSPPSVGSTNPLRLL